MARSCFLKQYGSLQYLVFNPRLPGIPRGKIKWWKPTEKHIHKQIQSIPRYWSHQTWFLSQREHDSLYLLRLGLAEYYKTPQITIILTTWKLLSFSPKRQGNTQGWWLFILLHHFQFWSSSSRWLRSPKGLLERQPSRPSFKPKEEKNAEGETGFHLANSSPFQQPS